MPVNELTTITLSVKELVNFTLLAGDIDLRFGRSVPAADGIRFHQALQKRNRENHPDSYEAEVPLGVTIERGGLILEIGGRVDGIFHTDETVTIEEIKTTVEDLDDLSEGSHPVHWAQAKCYAAIYAAENDLERVRVRLLYFQTEKRKTKDFAAVFTAGELAAFFGRLVDEYVAWAQTLGEWAQARDRSIASLAFPYPGYRPGQRELAVGVFRALKEGRFLFAQAPTGIGKTIATIFPAVKSVGEGHCSKIFYLTAKTVTRALAEKAYDDLRAQGLRFKTVTVTAKEKVCFCPEATACDPEQCRFAKGYYDRLKIATREIFVHDAFTRPLIEEYARKHELCPFEFALDLSLWADGIICDYNYVFDPRVYLRRFFDEDEGAVSRGEYAFLIDEAHNLADRAREMFSAEILKEPFRLLRDACRNERSRKKRMKIRLEALGDALDAVNDLLIEAREERAGKDASGGEARTGVEQEAPKRLLTLLKEFHDAAEKLLLAEDPFSFRDELLDRYFEAHGFLRTAENYAGTYVTYYERPAGAGNDLKVKLFCVDPSFLLSEALKRGRSAVFFSATLDPLDYFVELFGGGEEPARLELSSPFPRENRCVLLDDTINTRYAARAASYDEVAQAVAAVVNGKVGNYLVYFPSYRYLREVQERFARANPDVAVISQREEMPEAERQEFLAEFSSFGSRTLVGFAVMGGVFGEGIDLVGERLSGVVVVGVGLPQVCRERDIIRTYFEETKGKGFEYAYIYPGINKVLQAAGRLIRSETDRGVILLIDQRFSRSPYRDLLPAEWQPLRRISGAVPPRTAGVLRAFWRGQG